MLKKLIILLFVAAPLSAFAQNKLAYINTQEVFMAMPEISGVESQIATKRGDIRKNLEAMDAEYNKKLQEFQDSKEEVTESLALDRQKQLQQIQERFQTYSDNSSKELQTLQEQLVTPIQQKLQKAIKDVGDEQGYTYIIEAGTLPYISTSAVDAAPLVKAKLGIK